MTSHVRYSGCLWLVWLAMLTGCSSSSPPPSPATSAVSQREELHGHDGWWCTEHGVPEEVCGLCDAKLAAQFQKDGDWCREHDRPDSQCFVCHPEYAQRFAALYTAKTGEPPPQP